MDKQNEIATILAYGDIHGDAAAARTRQPVAAHVEAVEQSRAPSTGKPKRTTPALIRVRSATARGTTGRVLCTAGVGSTLTLSPHQAKFVAKSPMRSS